MRTRGTQPKGIFVHEAKQVCYGIMMSFAKTKLLILTLMGSQAVTASAYASEDLPKDLYEILGIDDRLPHYDLRPLGNIADESKIIALGESVHASGGYYQAKVRLIQYLVERKHYRIVAMETPWPMSEVASRYVETCEGTSEQATQSLFRVFQDKTTEQLLEWLCRYNQQHPKDRVEFWGFDVQDPAVYDILRDYIEMHDLSGEIAHDLNMCAGSNPGSAATFMSSEEYRKIISGEKPINEASHGRCLNALAKIRQNLSLADNESAGVRLALVAASGFQKQLFHWMKDYPASFSGRDGAMAEIFATRQHRSNKKAVIWAHNDHIRLKGTDSPWTKGLKPFGGWLNDSYPNEYSPIMLTGYRVETNWPWSEGSYAEYPKNEACLESRLHAYGKPFLFFDLRGNFLDHAALIPDRVSPESLRLSEYYRGVFFLDHSIPMDYIRQSGP